MMQQRSFICNICRIIYHLFQILVGKNLNALRIIFVQRRLVTKTIGSYNFLPHFIIRSVTYLYHMEFTTCFLPGISIFRIKHFKPLIASTLKAFPENCEILSPRNRRSSHTRNSSLQMMLAAQECLFLSKTLICWFLLLSWEL